MDRKSVLQRKRAWNKEKRSVTLISSEIERRNRAGDKIDKTPTKRNRIQAGRAGSAILAFKPNRFLNEDEPSATSPIPLAFGPGRRLSSSWQPVLSAFNAAKAKAKNGNENRSQHRPPTEPKAVSESSFE